MSIGKSSITKRVAKNATEEKNIAPELVATTAAAPKAEEKKAPAKKSSASAKKPAAKKTAASKKAETTEKKVDTEVIANVAPETVAAVIGHEEKSGFEKVQLGDKLPVHLL